MKITREMIVECVGGRQKPFRRYRVRIVCLLLALLAWAVILTAMIIS